MANTMDKLAKELKAQMTASDERKPKPYDTQAEVLRVEDGTAWVHIPGGVEETPVRLTINAKKGDMVNIHVANGAAWITGNSTNPPTDDSTAIELNQKTSKNLFVLNEKVTNEFNNAWTEITQNSEEIKLKASQAAVNGLGERLSTAETNIAQNANAISLRATKTEVTDAKNAAIASANSTTDSKLAEYTKTADFSVAPDKIASTVSQAQANATSAANAATDQKLQSYSTITQTAEGLASKVSTTDYNGEEIASLINQAADSVKIKAKHVEINGQTTFNAIKSYTDNAYDAKGAASDVQTALRTEIDAKKSTWNLMSTSASGATYQAILGYAESTTIFTIDNSASGFDKATDVKVGDTVRLKYKATDMGSGGTYVYIIGKATQVPPTVADNKITLAGRGLDTTVIDGGHILTGTIDANKVNVSNLTVGAFGSTEQDKILNSEIQVGSRNLLKELDLSINATIASTKRFYTENGWWGFSGTLSLTSVTRHALYAGVGTFGTHYIAGSGTYTLTNWAENLTFSSSTMYIRTYIYSESTGDNTRSFNCTSANSSITFTVPEGEYIAGVVIYFNTAANGISLDNAKIRLKLEKGNKATDWTPAPEDRENAGGRNYAKTNDGVGYQRVTSGVTATVSDYGTVTLNGTATDTTLVLSGTKSFGGLNLSVGSYKIWFTNTNGTNIWPRIGKGTSSDYKYSIEGEYTKDSPFLLNVTEEDIYYIGIAVKSGATFSNFTTSIMWEKCTVTDFSPAPEDVGTGIDDAATKATNYITSIDSNNGIRVHAQNNPTSNYAKINSDGMEVYKGGVSVAKYGDTSRIGKIAASNGNIRTNSTGMDLYVNTTKVGSFHQQTGYTPEDRAETYNNALFIDAAEYFAIRSSSTLKPMIETNGTEVDINFGGSSLITADDFNAAEGGGPVTFELWGHDSSEITDPDPDVDFSTFINVYGGIDDGDGGVTGVGIGVGDDGNQHGVWSSMKDRWLIASANSGEVMCPGVYLNTTSGGSNVRILGTNASSFDYMMKRYASSSRRYKTEIDDISDDALDPNRLYDARVVQFKYKDGYLGEDDQRNGMLVNGFIAEELDDIYPIAVQYENGLPEDWEPKFLIPPMLKLIQDQKKKIDELEARIEKLEKKL